MNNQLSYNNPQLVLTNENNTSGKVCWQAPSNIALVKYWGKFGNQLPCNPSISFSLKNSVTVTTLAWEKHDKHGLTLEFSFNGEANDKIMKRVFKYLNSLNEIFPFLNQLKLKIDSVNNFPHAAGIASSASAMASLALCLCSLEQELFETNLSQDEFLQKASYLARLGSGSAARSIYGGIVVWGDSETLNSSNQFATPVENLDEIFSSYQDAILIVDSQEKAVSSTVGHSLMNDHPFAESRFKQANQNIDKLLAALQTKDLNMFEQIVEIEALTLHSMMMTSSLAYLLLKPNTIAIIEKIRVFREQTGLPIAFTLDAGPNIHLLYPKREKDEVESFIQEELIDHVENKRWISDEVGQGPKKIC